MDEMINSRNNGVGTAFYDDIKSIILDAKKSAKRSIDSYRVLMYRKLGERIFEEEQNGEDRVEYGSYIVKNLAVKLESEFGSGFSVRQLELCRQFYRLYPITNALRSQLNWYQYRLLIRIDDAYKREYYEHEATNNAWTGRELERQINSLLYERLLLSNDKEAVLAVARKERIPENPMEIIKDPMVLEFLDLKRKSHYYEKNIESAIITHLSEFLLELGNGFTFVARQKRILLEDDEFFENPTVGILLCTDKNNTVVKFSLPENNTHILTSQYQLYLPSEEALLMEIKDALELVEGGGEDG